MADDEPRGFLLPTSSNMSVDAMRRMPIDKPGPVVDRKAALLSGGDLGNETERKMYRSALREETLTILDRLKGSDDQAREIRGRIHKNIHEDLKASLYREVSRELGSAAVMSLDEQSETRKVLGEARGFLIKVAGSAGVFHEVNMEVGKVSEGRDYSDAHNEVRGIDRSAMETRATESLNRASPDFGGMSDAYLSYIGDCMNYAELMAAAERAKGKKRTRLEGVARRYRESHIDGSEFREHLERDFEKIAVDEVREKKKRKKENKKKKAKKEQQQQQMSQERQQLASTLSGGMKDLTAATYVMHEAATAMLQEYQLAIPLESEFENRQEFFEAQRQFVRTRVEQIEDSNQDCYSYANATRSRLLETSLRVMDPEIADEVRVRLALHDSSILMNKTDGWIERTEEVGAGHTVGSAASESQERGHEIDNTVIDNFFEEAEERKEPDPLAGFRTAEAWDLLQGANYDYESLIIEMNDEVINDSSLSDEDKQAVKELFKKCKGDPENKKRKVAIAEGERVFEPVYILEDDEVEKLEELLDKLGPEEREKVKSSIHNTSPLTIRDDEKELGKVATNYFTDKNVTRKRAVTAFLERKLGGDENAERSLELAERMANATREDSVFNRTAVAGNDQMAEFIGFRGYRAGRIKTGRIRGPEVSVPHIPGFGTSYLRKTLERDMRRELREAQKKAREAGKNEREVPQTINDIPLTSEMVRRGMKKGKFEEGSWGYFCTVTVSRYHLLRGILLDKAPKPGMGRDYLQRVIVYFNTADAPFYRDEEEEDKTKVRKAGLRERSTSGPLGLKNWWVAGVLDETLRNPDSEWTPKDYGSFLKALEKEVLGQEDMVIQRPALDRNGKVKTDKLGNVVYEELQVLREKEDQGLDEAEEEVLTQGFTFLRNDQVKQITRLTNYGKRISLKSASKALHRRWAGEGR